jgi:hypothetical protein
MSGPVVEGALKEAEHVLKKQKTCATRSLDCVKQLLIVVNGALAGLAAGIAPQAILQELSDRMEQLGVVSKMVTDTKELHGSVSKLGKVRTGYRCSWKVLLPRCAYSLLLHNKCADC